MVQCTDVRQQALNNITMIDTSRFILSGPNYLRLWYLTPLKEVDAFLSLKQEKQLVITKQVFVIPGSEYENNSGTVPTTADPKKKKPQMALAGGSGRNYYSYFFEKQLKNFPNRII